MNNIAKKVFCLDNGKYVGYVLGVAVDEKLNKIGYYVVEEESETEFFVSRDEIVSYGQDAIFVQDETALQYLVERRRDIIGKSVYDADGVCYGHVESVGFQKERCQKIQTNLCEIVGKNVSNIKDDVIFVEFKKKRRNRKIFHTETKIDVFTQKKTVDFEPERVSLSQKTYVGKIAERDVFGYNNERIVSGGEKITKNIFENAKKHNKLNELFFVLKN
ncbi:MAG: hypothetical protein IJ817_03910 [Clostridia bacterium]|nr:hypothetical protein [Clostridia bacterium]